MMADKDNEDLINDREAQAIRYQTIWTNSLFDKDDGVFKYSRMGRLNIRIPKSWAIWGVASVIVSTVICFGILRFILPPTMLLILAGPIYLFTGLLFINLGSWSPMKKDTGEDFITYMKLIIRNKIGTGGFGKGPQSRGVYVTKALKNFPEGRPIGGKLYLGTQPLRTAPFIDNRNTNHKTEFHFYPRGTYKNVDIGEYNASRRFRRLGE